MDYNSKKAQIMDRLQKAHEQSHEEYLAEVTLVVEALADTKLEDSCATVTQRNDLVESIVWHYYWQCNRHLPSYLLELLANYLLIDTLKDKDVDKVANNEYPVLSDVQVKRRVNKQIAMQDDTIDFLNTKKHKQVDSLAKKVYKKAEY